jgi:hypothetical protein
MTNDTGDYSEITSFEPVALEDLQNPLVRQAVTYWRSLCGSRRYPEHRDLDPRTLSPFHRHMILLKVVDGGADFEYRFVGEIQRTAYTKPVSGKRMSETLAGSPFGPAIFSGYQYIQKSGITYALRGWAGKDYKAANFAYFESVTLPLGPDDATVDHLIVFSAYAPRHLKPVLA